MECTLRARKNQKIRSNLTLDHEKQRAARTIVNFLAAGSPISCIVRSFISLAALFVKVTQQIVDESTLLCLTRNSIRLQITIVYINYNLSDAPNGRKSSAEDLRVKKMTCGFANTPCLSLDQRGRRQNSPRIPLPPFVTHSDGQERWAPLP